MKFINRGSSHISIVFFLALSMLTHVPLRAQGYLHATGQYIYDGSNKEVILRGIGTGNWMIQEGYMMQTSGVAGTQHDFRAKLVSTIGEAKTDSFYTVWLDSHFRRVDVDSMKAWGFNSIRVAMHYKWFTPPIEQEPVPGSITWIEKGFTMIDSLLSWCSDNQMYLILDLHGAPGGQGKDSNISDYDDTKDALWENPLNKDKTIALWRKLAERYSTEPWIGGYDLINETNWTFPEGNNSQLWTLLTNITNAIREVDKNHIIFYEGNWFANDYSGLTFPAAPNNTNIVLSFHKYWDNPTQASFNDALTRRTTLNRPIWLGESGENSNTWFTNAIATCEKNRIGWSWWPVKKPATSNILKVNINSDYTQLVNFWKGSVANPGVDKAFDAVLHFAKNHTFDSCTIQRDVIDAMIRQTKTTETIPFQTYQIGDPIFAVNYNLGRNNYAYFDVDTANISGSGGGSWNSGGSYRNDGVDIEACKDTDASNGYNVGWTANGEWMEYTIDVDSTASYTLSIRHAGGGSKVHLEEKGAAISSFISLSATAGTQTWRTTQDSGIVLSKGTHKIRFVIDQGGCNLNYFRLSDPVLIENLAFKSLYAKSSVDGKTILISLNKPVTSAIADAIPGDFTVNCSGTIIAVSSVSLSVSNPNILILNLTDPVYYGGTITVSYQGSNILNQSKILSPFINTPVINNLLIRYSVTARIQAEDFAFNNGMSSETCTDTNGGLDMGYAHAGDYLDYRIYVPQSKYYKINFRVASGVSGTQLIIRTGEGTTFTPLDTLMISSTGGWQTWTTLSSTVYLPQGRYTIRLFVKQGQFNINWFQGASASGVAVNTLISGDLVVYPNPAKDFVKIVLGNRANGMTEISVYDAVGKVMKTVKSEGESEVQISTSNFKKGVYYVVTKNKDYQPSTVKLLIF